MNTQPMTGMGLEGFTAQRGAGESQSVPRACVPWPQVVSAVPPYVGSLSRGSGENSVGCSPARVFHSGANFDVQAYPFTTSLEILAFSRRKAAAVEEEKPCRTEQSENVMRPWSRWIPAGQKPCLSWREIKRQCHGDIQPIGPIAKAVECSEKQQMLLLSDFFPADSGGCAHRALAGAHSSSHNPDEPDSGDMSSPEFRMHTVSPYNVETILLSPLDFLPR